MARPKKERPNRPDGLYEVKITVGKTFDGKLIRKSFYSSISKADAKSKASEYKINQAVSQQTGTVFIDKDVTFRDWAVKWLEIFKKGSVKEHTYNFTYRINVEKYLIPYFGNHLLRDIKQVDVQKYFTGVRIVANDKEGSTTRTTLAKSTLEKHKMILKDIFETAIDNDLCYKNPVKNIKLTAYSENSKKRVYNQAEALKAEEYSKQHKNGAGIVIILNTGIRRSELVGLKWSDIDFIEKHIHIQRSVVPTTGAIIEGGTKTDSSDRYIPVSDEFLSFLKELPRESEYVIPGQQTNKPRSPSGYAISFKRFMLKLSENTGLNALEPHELRHTYATILREKGIDIYTIQKVMGHSDVSITARIYIHNDLDVLRKSMGL